MAHAKAGRPARKIAVATELRHRQDCDGLRACGKMAFVRKDLYQGTTSVVPGGLQSALGALKTNHFLSAEGWRVAPAFGAERLKNK